MKRKRVVAILDMLSRMTKRKHERISNLLSLVSFAVLTGTEADACVYLAVQANDVINEMLDPTKTVH